MDVSSVDFGFVSCHDRRYIPVIKLLLGGVVRLHSTV
jgi:hypothetical protein